jgi:hypothetical protein
MVGEEQFYECAAAEADEEERGEAKNPPVPSITIALLFGLNANDDDEEENSEDENFDDLQDQQIEEEDTSFDVIVGEQYYECTVQADEEQSEAKNLPAAIEQILGPTNEGEEEEAWDDKANQQSKEDDSSFEVDGGSDFCVVEEEEEEQNETENRPASIELHGVIDEDEDEEYSRADECNPRDEEDLLLLEVDGQSEYAAGAEVEDEEQSKAENPASGVPSVASASGTIELLGLDRVFDDLGNVLTMSSYRLRGLPRKNYKE